MNEGRLDLDMLRSMSGGYAVRDVACPFCGPKRKAPSNRTRKVLRVWNDGQGFYTFHCERCGESGFAKDNTVVSRRGERSAPRPAAPPEPDKSELARFLLERSAPAEGTPVERYLRSRGCWVPVPAIRFLPPRDDLPPTMITRFGFPDDQVTGVHLTRLAPDGSGKAGTDKDKLMIGPSKGQPIVIADNPESTDLAVAEGIEDAASIALAMPGFTVWAAGAGGRIAALMELARGFERVVIAHDRDHAGERALNGYRRQDGTFVPGVLTLRPDAVPLDFGLHINSDSDANKIVRERGIDALRGIIEHALWREGQRTGLLRGDEQIWRSAQSVNGCFQ